MPAKSSELRVEMLEREMMPLKELPARVAGLESQIMQLRAEMRGGFSAIDDRLLGLESRVEVLGGRMDETRSEVHSLSDRVTSLGDRLDSSRTEMRVLHEEVIHRIGLLGEPGAALGKRGRARARKKVQ